MFKVNVMTDYIHDHCNGDRECIEYTTAIAEALGYKTIAKHYGKYIEFNFYNNFIFDKEKIVR